MARPRKDAEIGAKAFLGFRIPIALRQRLEVVAEHNSRVLADEARHAIEDYVTRAETLLYTTKTRARASKINDI